MKKIFFTLLSFCSIIFLNAQSFEKGNRIVNFQLGFVGYSGTSKHNKDTAASVKAGATGITLSPGMEWAVGKRISLGASLLYSHYFDTAKVNKPKANGLDANFLFNFHFVKSKKVDLFAGIKLGIAGIRYNPNDGSGNIYGSMGSARDLHFTGRFYFSDRTSIIASIAFPGNTFNKFGDNLQDTYTLKYHGVSIAAGVAIKLKEKNKEANSSTGK